LVFKLQVQIPLIFKWIRIERHVIHRVSNLATLAS